MYGQMASWYSRVNGVTGRSLIALMVGIAVGIICTITLSLHHSYHDRYHTPVAIAQHCPPVAALPSHHNCVCTCPACITPTTTTTTPAAPVTCNCTIDNTKAAAHHATPPTTPSQPKQHHTTSHASASNCSTCIDDLGMIHCMHISVASSPHAICLIVDRHCTNAMYNDVNALLDKDLGTWRTQFGGIKHDHMQQIRSARNDGEIGSQDGFFLHLQRGYMYVSRVLQGGNSRTGNDTL